MAMGTTVTQSASGRRDGEGRRQFAALDGLRGIAALAVVVFHIPNFLGTRPLPGAYLAVDLFFCISGFVLTHAYAQRLSNGMGLSHFMARRIIRLYPLYGLASLFSLLYIYTLGSSGNFRGNGNFCYFLNMLMIPVPVEWRMDSELFPNNFVAWSILLELCVSLLFARHIRLFLSQRRRWLLMAASMPALLVCALYYGALNLGVVYGQLPGAIVRMLFSFCAGVAIARSAAREPGATVPAFSFPTVALVVVLLFALEPSDAARPYYDVIVVVLLFPALVHIAARLEPCGRMREAAMALGSASYGIYVLQVPAVAFCAKLISLLHMSASLSLGLTFTVALFVLALGIDRYLDRPVRVWLLRRLTGRTPFASVSAQTGALAVP